MPLPVSSCSSSGGSRSIPCSFAYETSERARMWFDACSELAASSSSLFLSMPSSATTESTVSFPLVMVPVLSNAAVLAVASFSKTSPVLMTMPFLDERLIPETMATGAARISGQGEATTRTSANLTGSFEMNHAIPAMITAIAVNGTAYRSAILTNLPGLLSASLTN